MDKLPIIITLAASVVLNIILISFCTRTMHWANYWKEQYNDATKKIEPIPKSPYAELYDWEGDWE